MGRLAWGLELDISAANVKGNASVVTTGPLVTTLPSPTPSLTNSVAQSENFHLLSSARARIGWLAWPGCCFMAPADLRGPVSNKV